MNDQHKTKSQLIAELGELRCRVAELETANAERDKADEILRQSEKRFRALLEYSSEAFTLLRVDGTIIYENPAGLRLTGYTAQERLNQNALGLVHPDDLAQVRSTLARVIAKPKGVESVILRTACKDGSFRWIEATAINLLADPSVEAVVVNYRDITERKHTEEALRESESRFRNLFEHSPVAYQSLDEHGCFADFNAQLCALLGYTAEELLGKSFGDVWTPEARPFFAEKFTHFKKAGRVRADLRLERKDHTPIEVLLEGRIQFDKEGRFLKTHCILFDITERKRAEEQLAYLGTHDTLTGVYNRTFFETELARLSPSREFPISVLVADLDNMKETNDKYGHAAGDELLKRTSQVFQATFRASEIIARIGGDEFAVILPRTNALGAEQILQRIRENLAAFNRQHSDLLIHVSLGIATSEKNLPEAFTLADTRMYADKRTHKPKEDESFN